jgi:hypothetical protein
MASVVFPFLAPFILHFRDKKPTKFIENVVEKNDKKIEKDEDSDIEDEELIEEVAESSDIENTFKT